MKEIACLYTVYSVIEPFTKQLKQALDEGTVIHTLYDDFLATDPAKKGEFTKTNLERLRLDLKACELTGADIIVVTCSTITPGVRSLKGEFSVPIIAIDDAMMRKAVAMGSRIGLICTAESTKLPSTGAVTAAADAAGKKIDLKVLSNEQAIQQLKYGDPAIHDKLVLDMAMEMQDRDVIILAQASTAYMADAVQEAVGVPVVSSPQLCIEEILQRLN